MSFMQSAATAADAVLQCALPTFGPGGGDQVVVSATGTVLLTNAAYTVLEYVDVAAHPVARLLTDAAFRFTREYGDGTCRFLLMVVAALRRAALELGRTAAPSHGLPAKASSVSRPRVCAALLQLAHSATVQPPRESVSGDANPAALWDTCRQLLRCHLYNNYAPDVVDALADVAVAWLREAAGPHGAEPGGVLRAATQLLAEFPVVLADRGRLNASTVWPVGDPLVGGSLCRRHLLRTRRLQRTKWVVFRCALDGEHASAGGRGTPATVMVSSAHGLDAAVSFRALAADRLAGRLRRAGVTVVLCTLGVSDAFASACDERGVLVVQLVEEVQCERLCRAAGVSFLTDASDQLLLRESDVGVADAVTVMPVGQQTFLSFGGVGAPAASGEPHLLPPPQLLLRGATDGLCRQYQQSLRRCISVVVTWLSHGGGLVIAGARVPLFTARALETATIGDGRLPAADGNMARAIAVDMAQAVPLAVVASMHRSVSSKHVPVADARQRRAAVVSTFSVAAARAGEGAEGAPFGRDARLFPSQRWLETMPPGSGARLTPASAAWHREYWKMHAAATRPPAAPAPAPRVAVEPAGLHAALWTAAMSVVCQVLRVDRQVRCARGPSLRSGTRVHTHVGGTADSDGDSSSDSE